MQRGHKEQPEDWATSDDQFPYSILGGPVAQVYVPMTHGNHPCDYIGQWTGALEPPHCMLLRLNVQLVVTRESGSHRHLRRFARAAGTACMFFILLDFIL